MSSSASTSTDAEDRTSQASQDPTGTQTLRNRFAGDFSSRWRDVRGAIRQTVDRNDALRLQAGPSPARGTPVGAYRGQAVDDFGVDSDAARQAEWAAWFPAVLDRYIREPTSPDRVRDGRHYTATELRRAYARGLALANQDAQRVGLTPPDGELSDPPDVISRKPHQEALQSQYLATYEDVERAADETRTAVSRSLRTGLAAGVGVRELANRVNGRGDAVGQTRTVTIALSKTIDTTNEAVLTRADELGASELGVIPETVVDDEDAPDEVEPEGVWETAQDDRVCEICQSLAGSIYTVEEIQRGDAPRPVRDTHPSCRCRIRIEG